jgi:hypothetical protein
MNVEQNPMKATLTFLIVILFEISNAQSPTWERVKDEGGIDFDSGQGIATDALGNVYLLGSFYGYPITFGTTTLLNKGRDDVFLTKYDASGNIIWAKSAGSNSMDYPSAITIDALGDIYITGEYWGDSITFGNKTLRNVSGSCSPGYGCPDIFIAKYNPSGSVVWAKSAGGNSHDGGYGIAIDNNGYVYVVGSFYSPSINFDSLTLTNAGGENGFIAKYDLSGNALWVKRIGGSVYDASGSISFDALNNFYVVGTFTSPFINIGSTTLTNVNTDSTADIFIAKFDTNGNAIWAKSAGGSDNDYAAGIGVDKKGNINFAGSFASRFINFDIITLTNIGTFDEDIFITKYDSSGKVVWAKSAGGNYGDHCYCVASDTLGNVYIGGDFWSDSIAFDNIILKNKSVGNGPNIIVAKYDTIGNVVWAKCAGGKLDDRAFGINTDDNGETYLTGWFGSDSISFDNIILKNKGGYDIFFAKLSATVGTEESKTDNSCLIVYPNPSQDIINIRLNKNVIKGEMNIFNMLGEKIYSEPFSGKENKVYYKLNQGIYLVQIVNGNEVCTVKIARE